MVNDLTVDMGMDPETASLLRDVATRKEAAVAAEDFATVRAHTIFTQPSPPFAV
jgi:hypothetical protein